MPAGEADASDRARWLQRTIRRNLSRPSLTGNCRGWCIDEFLFGMADQRQEEQRGECQNELGGWSHHLIFEKTDVRQRRVIQGLTALNWRRTYSLQWRGQRLRKFFSTSRNYEGLRARPKGARNDSLEITLILIVVTSGAPREATSCNGCPEDWRDE